MYVLTRLPEVYLVPNARVIICHLFLLSSPEVSVLIFLKSKLILFYFIKRTLESNKEDHDECCSSVTINGFIIDKLTDHLERISLGH